ncbi:MAG: hypothetical protein U0791_04585 [Gemmataceae bacterium]
MSASIIFSPAAPAPRPGRRSKRIRLRADRQRVTGVLYVLDEPTIGPPPRDNERLEGTQESPRSRQHARLEHDREVIAAADYLLDFGPGAR